MANPTTNFGWQMPTSSDLVTDLPADFEVFGQAVDTALVDLKGGTTGQILSKTSNTDMDFTWVTTDDANAIQNAIVDAKGDLIAASAADTPARLAVGANGESLVADSSTATGLRYTSLFGANKNKIINGDFYVNQRSFASGSADNSYNFDRWQANSSGGTVTTTANTFTLGAAPVAGYEGRNFLTVATSGQTTSAQLTLVSQKIESVRTFANQTVTVSFWAKANSGTPKIAAEFQQNFGTGGSPSASVNTYAGQATLSTSWARYSVSVAVPSISGKTLGTNNNDLISLILWYSAGSDYNARTGSLGLQNATIDIWGVQVEAGSVATAFQTASGSIGGELALCQRYYYRQKASQAYSTFGNGNAVPSGNEAQIIISAKSMRVQPTSLDYSALALFDGNAVLAVTNLIFYNTGSDAVCVLATAATLIANRPYQLISNNNSAAYVGFSSEL